MTFTKDANSFRADDVVNGRYRITGMLGRGGYGAVYAAEHTGTAQPVALKMLSVDPSTTDDDVVARFYREARITAGLTDVHTVRVFDVGQVEDGPLFMAMELLRGPELNKVIRSRETAGRRVLQAEAIEIALPILQSLAEAHKAGLVHRDLKPANIIIATMGDNQSVVKVLDFGIARTQDSELTTEGQALGTPTYMSPDQVRGKSVDGRADLYSLGVILFRMLAGRAPFRADDSFALAFMHVQEEIPDLRKLCDDEVDDAMVDVIMRAMAKEPEDRFQSASEMHVALQKVAEQTRVTALAAAMAAETTPVEDLPESVDTSEAPADDAKEAGPESAVEPAIGMGPGGSVLGALVAEVAADEARTPSVVRAAFRKSEEDYTKVKGEDDPTAALPHLPAGRVLRPAANGGADAEKPAQTPSGELHRDATLALDTGEQAAARAIEALTVVDVVPGDEVPPASGGAPLRWVLIAAAFLAVAGGGAWAWLGANRTAADTSSTPSATGAEAPAAGNAADGNQAAGAVSDAEKVKLLISAAERTDNPELKIKLLRQAMQLAPGDDTIEVLLEAAKDERRKMAQGEAADPKAAAEEASDPPAAAATGTAEAPKGAAKPSAKPRPTAPRSAIQASAKPVAKPATAPTTPAPAPAAPIDAAPAPAPEPAPPPPPPVAARKPPAPPPVVGHAPPKEPDKKAKKKEPEVPVMDF